MQYKKIDKSNTQQPTRGTYRDWKQIIADEGDCSCVYCCIHEGQFGGIRNFHVEHYKPKSKFKSLTNNILNLFYACPICNTFKGSHWIDEPDDGNFEVSYYPNPSKVDYSNLISISKNNNTVKGKNFTGNYLIERLGLNRQQLILARKEYFVKQEYKLRSEEVFELIQIAQERLDNKNELFKYLNEAYKLAHNGNMLIIALDSMRPYSREDEARPIDD